MAYLVRDTAKTVVSVLVTFHACKTVFIDAYHIRSYSSVQVPKTNHHSERHTAFVAALQIVRCPGDCVRDVWEYATGRKVHAYVGQCCISRKDKYDVPNGANARESADKGVNNHYILLDITWWTYYIHIDNPAMAVTISIIAYNACHCTSECVDWYRKKIGWSGLKTYRIKIT